MTPAELLKQLNDKIKTATGMATDYDVKFVHSFDNLNIDNLTIDVHPLKNAATITFTHKF